MSFTIRTALLVCSLGWISRSESSIVEVQPGENATLLCSKLSSFPTHTVWFRLVNRTQPCCISIYNSIEPPSFCDGVDQEKFEVTSNFSTIFLKIKHVDLSDTGFYFCGYYTNGLPVIVNSMDLQVQEEAGETTNLTTLILSAVTVVLTKVIICLVVKMRLQTESESSPEY
uniref:Immunoglobulin domain-containing protein n=1 Tax=Astatotilapia calliptera TaxID=8154 RepID=A0A3P8PEL3_ASTCA